MKRLWCLFIVMSVFLYGYTMPLRDSSFTSPIQENIFRKKIDALNLTAINIYLANPGKARQNAQNALLLAKKYNYQSGIGQSFLNIGITYWSQSYYPISLFYLNTALKYFKNTDSAHLSDCYRNIGRNYVDLKDFKKALIYLNRADIQAGNDPEEHEQALAERSYAYLKSAQYDKSLTDTYEAIKICREIHKTGTIAILYGRLSSVYYGQKQFDKASAYCDTTYAMSFASKNKRLRVTALVQKGAISFNHENYEVAIKYEQQASKLADSLGVLELNSYANRWLYRSYQKAGDKDKAIFYQQAYIKLQDSLTTLDKQNSLRLIQDYFALNNKLNDIEEIQQKSKLDNLQIKSQRLTIYNLVFVVLLLAFLVYVLYRYSKQKIELSEKIQIQNNELLANNKLIEQQANNLDELNRLKDRLLAIIGHDLKTPVANLRTIVGLFDEGQFSPEELQEIMRDMDPAIKSAELTLSNLVEWAGRLLKGTDIHITTVDLFGIANETAVLFKNALSKKSISFIIDVKAEQKVLADENHVKMILRNLVSNAIKFTPLQGVITISCLQQDSNMTISVKDTGKGMTAAQSGNLFYNGKQFSDNGTEGEKGTGIGLLLCSQLVEINGGKISVVSQPGKGSTFLINLPAVKMEKEYSS